MGTGVGVPGLPVIICCVNKVTCSCAATGLLSMLTCGTGNPRLVGAAKCSNSATLREPRDAVDVEATAMGL